MHVLPTRTFFAAATLLAASLAATATPRPKPPQKWAIKPAQAQITFSIDAVGYPRTNGSFHDFKGSLTADFDHPERSAVSFEVASASVDVGSEGLNGFVRGDALLDAAHHPAMAFASTSVRKLDAHHAEVTGLLTLLGQARPLVVEVTVEHPEGAGSTRPGFTATAKIDRLAYGMNTGYPIISREIDLKVVSDDVRG